MPISEEQVRDALRSVRYPGFSRDIVSFGLVKGVQVDSGEVKVQLALATNDPNVPATIKNDAEKILRAIDGVRSAKVLIDIQDRKSTRLNSSHVSISYAVFCLKKKKNIIITGNYKSTNIYVELDQNN